jgi:hypothetical protein
MADEGEIRFLGDVQRLVLAPGDIVVLKTPFFVSPEQAGHLRDALRRELGDDRKVIVLPDGLEIGVLASA